MFYVFLAVLALLVFGWPGAVIVLLVGILARAGRKPPAA